MNRKLAVLLTGLLLILGSGYLFETKVAHGQQGSAYSQLARVAGEFDVKNYNSWQAVAFSGFTATGAQTLQIFQGGGVQLQDGTVFYPFNVNAPILVDAGQPNAEVVTPTAISGCQSYSQTEPPPCSITATFSNVHGRGAIIKSGTLGFQEAINVAHAVGAGYVSFDRITVNQGPSVVGQTGAPTSFNALVAALTPYQNVNIMDKSQGSPQWWNPQGGATAIATPTTLTSSTVGFGVAGANFTGGSYTGSNTYIACISYVDIMGQEGPCSATFTIATSGSATTDQIGFTAPAASTGAVGYTMYITLNGGSYTSAYKVPLVAQPATVGVAPAGNGVCTLTTIETITPACAVANTTYGQSGSTAVVSALTLNTSPIEPQATVISTTSIYVPNPGGRTTYAYVPGSHPGTGITTPAAGAFTIGAAAGTTVPDVLGTINIAPGAMNQVGKTLRVCGTATTTASTATIVDIQFQWDAVGQNTAGKGVLIGDLTATPTAAIATAGHATFCQSFQTTATGATATGGTMNHVDGFGAVGGLTLLAGGPLSDAMTGATAGGVASLNLAVDARLNIIYLHTTGTDGAGWTLQNVSASVE